MVFGFEQVTPALVSGFVLGLGMILSLGPQNLMLIEAGIIRRHAALVATTGYPSEILVVAAGVAFLGSMAEQYPSAAGLLRLAGILFLLWCAWKALSSARGSADHAVSLPNRS